MSNSLLSRRHFLLGSTSLLALSGCVAFQDPEISLSAPLTYDLSGLPYHPLPFHLDLCVLSYQLYGQSLVWPLDPYYEKTGGGSTGRKQFMSKVKAWSKSYADNSSAKFGGYRGPGALAGFANNPNHDPIIYQYGTLSPWRPAITLPEDRWTEQRSPSQITRQIREIYMCYRPAGKPEGTVKIETVARAGRAAVSTARDVVLAFEGGTGDKGEAEQPASQSLMGFILLRYHPDSEKFDVHITFRGSRSGSLARAATQAFSDSSARGNPDWITDLGYDRIGPNAGGSHVSTVGKVHRGFTRSIQSIQPQLMRCLTQISKLTKGAKPNRIFVTGHSLGGALAQHFTSAILLGSDYGPNGNGPKMPTTLESWPWQNIKLVSFSAPVGGDAQWAQKLTIDALQSNFFAKKPIGPLLVDPNALAANDPSIVTRLTDPAAPAGIRVLASNDPVTSMRVIGGKHVGQTVYVNKASAFGFIDSDAHEPSTLHKLMRKTLSGPAIPASGWNYRKLTKANPGRNVKTMADPREFLTLAAALEAQYHGSPTPFDSAKFSQDFAIFNSFLNNSQAGSSFD